MLLFQSARDYIFTNALRDRDRKIIKSIAVCRPIGDFRLSLNYRLPVLVLFNAFSVQFLGKTVT